MNAALKFLKPAPVVIIFLLLIVVVQYFFFSSHSYTYSMEGDEEVKVSAAYGFGSPVTAEKTNDSTDYSVNWPMLLVNAACCYVIAVIMAWLFSSATKLRRPATAFGVVAAIMVIISFCLSIGLSKAYWGYFFSRPPVLNEMNHIASVTAIIPIDTQADEKGVLRIVTAQDYSISKRIEYGKKDPYYCLDERLLIALEQRGLLPGNHSLELKSGDNLYALIQDTGILATPEKGYNTANQLRGVLIDTRSNSGQRLVFMGLTSGQQSNDHYPYYELLFSADNSSSELQYVRGQRFFYDVAGIEGAEWYAIWPFLALAGTIVGFVLVAIGMLLRRFIFR